MAIQPDIWTIPFEGNPNAGWIESAARVFSDTTGSPARLSPIEVFACQYRVMQNVVRCAVEGRQETVIIRRPRNFNEFDPGDDRVWGPTYQFYDYWAGCAFGLPRGTQFFGGSKREAFIVLEDVGDDASLHHALRGDNPNAAIDELMAFGVSLGETHAASIDRESEYLDIRNGLLPNKEQVSHRDANFIHINLDELRGTIEGAGVTFSDTVESDIRTIIETLEEPGPYLSFIHRDPIPPNFIRSKQGLVPIDLEFSGYGHLLADITTVRMGMPTYGHPKRVPPEIVDRLEKVYRETLSAGCDVPLDGDTYWPAYTSMCGWWLLMELIRNLAKTTDEESGEQADPDAIVERQKWVLTRLSAFNEVSGQSGCLTGLADLSRNLTQALTERWGTDTQVPLFAAFDAS